MVTMVELEEQGPAMTALGSLLKLTKSFPETARDGSGEGSNLLDSECGTFPEDMELTKQMNALGLPVSFLTNKEKRNRKAEGKRKGMRLKHPVTSQGYVVEALESSKDCDSLHSSAVVNDTMKLSASTTDLNDGIFSGSCSTDAAISQESGERLMEHDHLECSLMTLHEAEGAKICEDYVPEKPCVSESVSYSMCSEVLDMMDLTARTTVMLETGCFRNKTKQLVADEVYKNDLEPILAEKTDEPNTIDLYNEPSKINSCEETLEDFEGDDAFQILDMSSLSNTYTEEVSEYFICIQELEFLQ
ncbi:uncharacterized protein Pyn_28991 [Prunus yedoensis var. nudiflora]|uniref:Uncharacterized protein n=1 Tax=Prunus yedoensis var. nudiflora TaxID=2094558 RepID=A0A314ZEB9_PRUYE|nr:uncharacterized protein Pyn_28991 [Prunus yedoensis var. nudiflora]